MFPFVRRGDINIGSDPLQAQKCGRVKTDNQLPILTSKLLRFQNNKLLKTVYKRQLYNVTN